MHPLTTLVHELSKLPGIGEKTALRLALYVLRQPPEYGRKLAKALHETLEKVHFCENCLNISNKNICHICENPERNAKSICVVEDIADLMALETTHAFRGQYHVLHGCLSPIDGIGPDQLHIPELKKRLENKSGIEEIIIATNPNVNGDATAHYLSKIIKPFGTKITRLASGIPLGGHIEFIDQNTLSRALEQRMDFE